MTHDPYTATDDYGAVFTVRGCVQVLLGAAIAAHATAFIAMSANATTAACAPLGILAAPFAYNLCKFAFDNHTEPAAIKPLKKFAMRWHMAMTAALFLALLTSGVAVYGPDSLV